MKNLQGREFISTFYDPYINLDFVLNRTASLNVPLGGALGENLDELKTTFRGHFVTTKSGKKKYYCKEYYSRRPVTDQTYGTSIYSLAFDGSWVGDVSSEFIPNTLSGEEIFENVFWRSSMKYDTVTVKKKNFYLKDTAALIENVRNRKNLLISGSAAVFQKNNGVTKTTSTSDNCVIGSVF